jgi:hypothetical protein
LGNHFIVLPPTLCFVWKNRNCFFEKEKMTELTSPLRPVPPVDHRPEWFELVQAYTLSDDGKNNFFR